jgi:hypothetical protein
MDARMPFTGDFQGFSWNAQALFAKKKHRHHPKVRHALRLAQQHDFRALQESHSTPGAAIAFQRQLPRRMKAFWSHGTARQAGIGLIIKSSFLDNFNPVRPQDWEIVEADREAVLRLRGPQGGLGIYAMYLASGEEQLEARSSSIKKVGAALRPSAENTLGVDGGLQLRFQ